MILFQKYSPMLIVELQKFIAKSQSITLTETTDVSDLLIKDSIYNATGLAVFNLFDEVGNGCFTHKFSRNGSLSFYRELSLVWIKIAVNQNSGP